MPNRNRGRNDRGFRLELTVRPDVGRLNGEQAGIQQLDARRIVLDAPDKA